MATITDQERIAELEQELAEARAGRDRAMAQSNRDVEIRRDLQAELAKLRGIELDLRNAQSFVEMKTEMLQEKINENERLERERDHFQDSWQTAVRQKHEVAAERDAARDRCAELAAEVERLRDALESAAGHLRDVQEIRQHTTGLARVHRLLAVKLDDIAAKAQVAAREASAALDQAEPQDHPAEAPVHPDTAIDAMRKEADDAD